MLATARPSCIDLYQKHYTACCQLALPHTFSASCLPKQEAFEKCWAHSPHEPPHTYSAGVAACASMSTTTTTTRDRGDRYGPMEWAQQALFSLFKAPVIEGETTRRIWGLSCWRIRWQVGPWMNDVNQGLKTFLVSRRTSCYGRRTTCSVTEYKVWILYLLTVLVIGSSVSLLWEMMLWLSVSVSCTRKRYSKRCKFRPKLRQNALRGQAPPGPAGGAWALPQTP